MLLLVAPVLAAFPEQISVLAMEDYNGASTFASSSGEDYVAAGYKQVAKDLGCAIANKPFAPAETLGLYGFYVGVATTVAFVDTGFDADGNPSGWTLVDPEEDASPVMVIPRLQVRKGLPLSIELAGDVGWIASSATGVVSGSVRAAPLEGYRYLPDFSVQVGYSAYVGNDELEVGTSDVGLSVGYSLPFGSTAGVNSAEFSPYIGISFLSIHAAPRVDLSRTNLVDRVIELDGDAASTAYDQSMNPVQLGGGFRIKNGGFVATIAGSWSPESVPTVNVGFGGAY